MGFNPVHIVEAQGQVEGLWVLVQHGITQQLTMLNTNPFSTIFSITAGSGTWLCTTIYDSPIPTIRAPFWQYLCDLSNTIDCLWLMLGDFNEILLPGDQRGGNFLLSRAEAFALMYDQCGMVDLNTIGSRFTWHRNCKGNRAISKKT